MRWSVCLTNLIFVVQHALTRANNLPLSNCTFCARSSNGGSPMPFDLSNVPTTIFTLHSGTRGDLTDPRLTYYATSPCGSVGDAPDDMCFSGPTSDPAAQHYTGTTPDGRYGVAPICSGLGSLGASIQPTVIYSAGMSFGGSNTLNITLHGGSTEFCNGNARVTYAMICDKNVHVNNAPEPRVNVVDNCSFIISWRHPSACATTSTESAASLENMRGQCDASNPAPPAPSPVTCKGCLPPWIPTWDMMRSTVLYTCNYSGFHNVSEAVRYGIVSYDWSNAKALWANAQPMSAEELITKQAEMVLARDPGIEGEQPRVWVYRNKIKGLNWFKSVREKLDDPQYAGWFVKFKDYKGPQSNNSYHPPACDWYGNASHPPKCSGFYHDQGQTPNHPGASRSVYPVDGECDFQCNCGPINPCGEYTFDHRNESFSKWFINGWMINNETLLHKPTAINLGWLDDEISLQGMSEGGKGVPYPTWVADTGSTPEDMQDHVDAFRRNIAKLQKATVENGGFYWQMVTGRGPLIRAKPAGTYRMKTAYNVTAEQCISILRKQFCTDAPEAWQFAHMYEVWPTDPNIGEQAVAEFLLTRGDFAWIGYSWAGCERETQFPRPAEWDYDYGGKALTPCVESEAKSGVFIREYPKATVQWDCHSGRGSVKRHANLWKTASTTVQ